MNELVWPEPVPSDVNRPKVAGYNPVNFTWFRWFSIMSNLAPQQDANQSPELAGGIVLGEGETLPGNRTGYW